MTMSTDLLKANHIGVRELKQTLSSKMLTGALVITDRGRPISISIPYDDMMDLLELFDELADPETMKMVQEGRSAVQSGMKGIPASRLIKKLRQERSGETPKA